MCASFYLTSNSKRDIIITECRKRKEAAGGAERSELLARQRYSPFLASILIAKVGRMRLARDSTCMLQPVALKAVTLKAGHNFLHTM